MHVLFNDEKLARLIPSLVALTGIQTNICDISGQDVRLFGEHCEFCRLINSDPEGHGRCTECDRQAVEKCAKLRKAYMYRCHAGLLEVVVPILNNSEPVAFISFGQLLDESSREEQWSETQSLLSWYQGDMSELGRAFSELTQCSERKITAYEDILEAVVSHIITDGIVRSAEHSDKQRLELYLEQHYTEKLSLKKISAELHIGTTKLCALAKEIAPDSSITKLISQKRVTAAKKLLLKENLSIAAISETVGFSDYNYFTKIFRKHVGMTPTDYRKYHQK